MYKCAKCDKPVLVIGETKVKSCKCEATIIASCEGNANGKGGIKI